MAQWSVYMILTQKDRLYTGVTKDVNRRFRQHAGIIKGGAKFFKSDPPALLVFEEKCPDYSSALKKEYSIKKLTRQQKVQLASI